MQITEQDTWLLCGSSVVQQCSAALKAWNSLISHRRAFYFAHLASSLNRWFETIILHSGNGPSASILIPSKRTEDRYPRAMINQTRWRVMAAIQKLGSALPEAASPHRVFFLLADRSFLLASVTPAIPSCPRRPLLWTVPTAVVLPMTSALLAKHPSRRTLANIFISYLLWRYGVMLFAVNTNIYWARCFFLLRIYGIATFT